MFNAAEALTLALDQRIENNDPLPVASKIKGGTWVEPSASVQAAILVRQATAPAKT